MAFFNFLSGLLKRKKPNNAEPSSTKILSTQETADALSVVSDLSLRANGETYLDRDGEAEQIFKRIQSNSSSVIGIGGVRGAGKSSLALKVLQQCETKDYFTILIPSPTAYDSKEFLLTLYQCICEKVKSDLEVSLKRKITIIERTEREIGNNNALLKGTNRILQIVILLSLLGLLNYLYIYHSISYLTNHYYMESDSLKDFIGSGIVQPNIKSTGKNQPDTFSKLGSKSTVYPDSIAHKNKINNPYLDTFRVKDSIFQSVRKAKIADLKYQLQFPNIFNPLVIYEYSIPNSYFVKLFITPLGWFVLIFTLIFIMKRIGGYLKLRNVFLKSYAIENGLYKLTNNKLEWLVYQVKLSSSTELTAPVSKFTAKLSKQKSLETRPLSLPGITSDFNNYIQNITSFKTKIIVCIDELDKIEDPTELNLLLKGIKGIIGQNKTHFILTVSEDALAKFSTRFRQERDLLESSFEEIYILNKVSFKLASQIIINTYYSKPNKDETADFDVNRMLVWIFGNAIPREIKRTMIVLSNADMNLAASAKFDIWRRLMLASISSMRSWALINNDDEFLTYDFLLCLEQIENTLPKKTFLKTAGLAWYKSLLTYFSKYYKNRITGDKLDSPIDTDLIVIPKISDFEKAIFEISLLSLSLLLVADDGDLYEETSNRIQEIFELLPYSYLLSINELYKYLVELGIDIT